MPEDIPDFLKSENPGKERLRAAREANELFNKTYPRVADMAWKKELTEQVIGLNRMIAYLLLEQGKTSIEIPARIMIELDDSWELVVSTNGLTQGKVIELRGVPSHDGI